LLDGQNYPEIYFRRKNIINLKRKMKEYFKNKEAESDYDIYRKAKELVYNKFRKSL
jgi:hypothetical protein